MTGLPPEPFPWPLDGADYRMAMGLRALPAADWISPDDGWPAQLAERERLLSDRRTAVLALMPEARAAADELLALLLHHLSTHHPAWFRPMADGGVEGCVASGDWRPASPGPTPLDTAGRLVPDDLCLMTRTQGGWRLTGAVLCFPNRWRLDHKLGKPMPGIHRPVPGYDARLATPVDRFLDGLAAGRAVWRLNWALNDDPALHQPLETAHTAPDITVTADNAADRLFLRVERQSLRRLPASGAVVFTIRTHQRPLGALSADQAAQLAAVLRSTPDDVARYKGLPRTAGPALAVLDRLAASGA